MRFRDRMTAGIELAEALEAYRESEVVVYALPRGGVPVAEPIARALNAVLDVAITRKIGHPSNPEYAVCAIAEDGEFLCDPIEEPLLDEKWLQDRKEEELSQAKQRRKRYGNDHVSAQGKTIIVVDDGVATGLTLRAALRMLKKEESSEIIVAVPVIPQDVATLLRDEGYTVVALYEPEVFLGGVGAYYAAFDQTTDEEVMELLQKYKEA